MARIVSGRVIAENSLLNFLGLTSPLLVGLITIPSIIEGFGIERFGFLTLSWAVIGYFTLFDMGLSRALTYSISRQIISGSHKEKADLIWTSLKTMLFFGLLGAAALFVLSQPVIVKVLKVSAANKEEFILSLKILSFALPITIISTGLKGILEAHQSFVHINAIQILIGSLNFVAPLLTLQVSENLSLAIGALSMLRIIALILYILACIRVAPEIKTFRPFNIHCLKGQLHYGGWITVSTIVGPVMVYFDRFVIASILSVSVVAYYTTPYEIVSKVTLIAVAISGAVFPALSSFSGADRLKTIGIFDKAIRYVLISVFPVVLIFVCFAFTGLNIWLGTEFAHKSFIILQWLAVGVFLNCIAFIPYGFIQAHRRPDITAKIHLAELPFYLISLFLFIQWFGIIGAAIAWTLRAGIDGALLFIMSGRIVPEASGTIKRNGSLSVISLLMLALCAVLSAFVPSWYYIGVAVFFYTLASWFYLLTDSERLFLRQHLRL